MSTQIMHTEFPTTGQPIRVVMIDGEPWFVVMDVCRILGIGSSRTAAAALAKDQKLTVDIRQSSVGSTDGTRETPAQPAYATGNPRVTATNDDQPFEVRNDGSVHCPHGQMRLIAPVLEDELEPPFGPYLLCAEVERVGIRRHMAHRPCARLLFTAVVRHLLQRSWAPAPDADLVVNLGPAQLRGKAGDIAEVLHRLGISAPAY